MGRWFEDSAPHEAGSRGDTAEKRGAEMQVSGPGSVREAGKEAYPSPRHQLHTALISLTN